MLASLGILVSLCLLMGLAYRGYSVIVLAPVFALLAALFSGLSLMPTYTEIFLPQMAGYIKIYFPFFLLGAIFGRCMEVSGAAEAIAKAVIAKLGHKHATLAVVLSCAILTYGGVSLFVVAFAVYPFAASLFREARIPKRLLPATIALGAFTFTMDALPGTPQIQNSIPMKFFNTDLYAAPVFGILGAILVFGLGLFYLERKRKQAQVRGEDYGVQEELKLESARTLPPLGLALLPLLGVLVLTLLLQKVFFPQWPIADWASLAPYNMNLESITGTMNNWALIIGLAFGIAVTVFIQPRQMSKSFATALNLGATGSLLAVMNTASEVGFGNVIKVLPGFKTISTALMSIQGGGSPLLSEAVTVNVLSGITGSASGGMSIALDAFAKDYMAWADRAGINHQLLHRVAAMASGGMDTLPHNGAVITLFAITGMTHRQAYKDIFVITCLKTLVVFVLIGINGIVALA